MAVKKSKKTSKGLKRGKKLGTVKPLSTIRRGPGGSVELNPQPLPP